MTRRVFPLLALAAGLTVVLGTALVCGPVRIPLDRVLHQLVSDDHGSVEQTIVRQVRLPRALLAGLAGAGLAVTGAAFQGLFRNPLADPYVVGSASGAAVGATVVLAFGWASVPFGAFLGALSAAALVISFAGLARGMPLVSLLLAGAAVSSLLNASVWVILAVRDESLEKVINWLLGSFSQRGWPEFHTTWPWLVTGCLALWVCSRPLDALAGGEATARSLGLNVRLASAAILAFGSLAIAAAVAAGGVIGFVGFVAPYLARRVVGNRHVVLLPASALVGAALLILSDTVARVVLAPVELRVGVVTALLAGPFFLLILRGKR